MTHAKEISWKLFVTTSVTLHSLTIKLYMKINKKKSSEMSFGQPSQCELWEEKAL